MSNIIDSPHEKYRELIAGLRIMDDDFMRLVLDDIETVELVIQIILDKSDISVIDVKPQYEVHSLDKHSVRLDIRAVDSKEVIYNIEIQRSKYGAAPKRARYNSSLIDANSLDKGKDYDSLPETYVIFITETDVLERQLPIYHIDRIIRETGEEFDDKSHIVYVNGEIKDDTPLGHLMNDFSSTDAGDMYYDKLADRVRYWKETEEGVSSMCEAIEKMRNEAAQETNTTNIKNLMESLKISIEKAMELLKVPSSDYDMYRKLVAG